MRRAFFTTVAIALATPLLVVPGGAEEVPGLAPTNRDDFASGDYRNFLPSVQASSPGRMTVTGWTPGESTVAEFEIRGHRGSHWRLEFQQVLQPGETYELAVKHGQQPGWQVVERHDAGSFGDNVFVVHLPIEGDQTVVIRQAE